jgi:lipopolysaccharide transport system ATP-binding protein
LGVTVVSEVAIRVEGLSKRFSIGAAKAHHTLGEALSAACRAPLRRLRRRSLSSDVIWALRDVGFEVRRGEVIGVIGRNGSGKSTLLKILSRITSPTAGRVELRGRVGSLLEVGTGFHPELTGRENIELNGAIIGMRRAEILDRFDEIVSFSGVERFLDTPVKRYSTGMRMRLAFAVAAHLEPEILLVDEVLAVGDAEFQRKCLGKMGEVAEGGRTVLFVSHNMAAVKHLCERAILLRNGELFLDGSVADAIHDYLGDPEPWSPREADDDDVIELADVRFIDAAGDLLDRVMCGETFSIALDLQSKRLLKRAVVQIALTGSLGERVSVLNSAIAGEEFTLPAERSRIFCKIADFSLVPGGYDIEIKVLVGGEMFFFDPRAGRLTVEDGDFFGTGRLVPTGWAGHCLLKQAWKLEPCASSRGE